MTTTESIQSILAPVVMITACALLLNNIGAQYTNFGNQVRSLAFDRIDTLQKLSDHPQDPSFLEAKLEIINWELTHLQKHHQSLHNAMMMIYLAIIACLICMFILGFSVVLTTVWIERAALFSFLAGMINLFIGMFLLTRCFQGSHQLEGLVVQKTCHLSRHISQSKFDLDPQNSKLFN